MKKIFCWIQRNVCLIGPSPPEALGEGFPGDRGTLLDGIKQWAETKKRVYGKKWLKATSVFRYSLLSQTPVPQLMGEVFCQGGGVLKSASSSSLCMHFSASDPLHT